MPFLSYFLFCMVTSLVEVNGCKWYEFMLFTMSSESSTEGGDENSSESLSSEESALEDQGSTGLLPYQFEPYADEASNSSSASSTDSSDSEQEFGRLLNTSWCKCVHCQIMQTEKECICCMEIEKVKIVKEEYEIKCITEHPGFEPICLNIHVLRVAYYQYRQQYGDRDEQNNERYRYTAYRQFVRWCWQYLGKDVRVVLPSCVVNKIRSCFPREDMQFKGFKEIQNPD